jgi:hypothetical protein
MSPETQKHLEMIQGVINRLAGNSFTIKGWAVTLATAVMALIAKDNFPRAALIAMVPLIGFCALDAFYLMLERRYVGLFTRTVNGQVKLFDMNAAPDKTQKTPWKLTLWGALFSPSIAGLYGFLIVLALIVATVGANWVDLQAAGAKPGG